MEVRIGVQNATRELVLDSAQSGDEVRAVVEKALEGATTLVLEDKEGRRVVVPTGALAYVDISEGSQRKVGFGNS